jgi:retron-type reverse transcriptase
MRRAGGLFNQIAAFPNLLAAAKAACRGKRFKPEPAAFQFDLESNLLRLQEELASRSYRPGAHRTFHIRDPKPRLISAAPYRDRVVHHAVCRIIEPIFDRAFIDDSFANRLGKGTHRALDTATAFCRKSRYVLTCDVEKFFPSTDHEVLTRLLARKIKCSDTLDLLRVIIEASAPQEPITRYFPGDDLFAPYTRRRGIPIGNLTSQLFANIMLDPLDHFVKEAKGERHYVRYADDLLVFGNDKAELHALLREMRDFLYGYRLALQPRKCVVVRVEDGVPFLGWRLYRDHRRLRRSTGVRFQRGLLRLTEAYARGVVGLDRVRASIASWIGHLKHGDTFGLRRKLLEGAIFKAPGSQAGEAIVP